MVSKKQKQDKTKSFILNDELTWEKIQKLVVEHTREYILEQKVIGFYEPGSRTVHVDMLWRRIIENKRECYILLYSQTWGRRDEEDWVAELFIANNDDKGMWHEPKLVYNKCDSSTFYYGDLIHSMIREYKRRKNGH